MFSVLLRCGSVPGSCLPTHPILDLQSDDALKFAGVVGYQGGILGLLLRARLHGGQNAVPGGISQVLPAVRGASTRASEIPRSQNCPISTAFSTMLSTWPTARLKLEPTAIT